MAKISNPVRFSTHFGVSSALLDAAGALDPSLNVDTGLFIDPMLLATSRHSEMNQGAVTTYRGHFEMVIKLLSASNAMDDVPWRNALRLLSFPEIKGICLGYSSESVSGSGSGTDMRNQLIVTAKQIIDLGITDPDLFVAMALFEEGFGPDRISDMTTNIIIRDLLAYNKRVLPTLPVPLKATTITLRNGKQYDADLPVNSFLKGGAPVILVPSDILRDLPIASDWSDVADAAAKNAAYRGRLNDQVARIWEAKSRKSKGDIRKWALTSKVDFETLLEMIHGVSTKPYDMAADPLGELVWRRLAETIAWQEPLAIIPPVVMDLAGICSVVDRIIEQFRFLIEERRFSEELYNAGKPRPEKSAQRLFFAVAHAYCKANNLDLTPEADTGNGPVDFKVSSGFSSRVLVEIKLSTNGKVVNGYTRQLETYMVAEETMKGYYVVIDVGHMGDKSKKLFEVKNAATARGEVTSPITIINGIRRLSASKL